MHGLRIHARLGRKIRTDEEQNTEILIVSVYCGQARKEGRQYTKRILPVFVIPRCTITLENVLRYVSKHSEHEDIDYDEASYLLGSYDPRTIRRHIQSSWQMLREALAGRPEPSRDLQSPSAPAEGERASPRQQADAGELIVLVHAVYVRFASATVRRQTAPALGRACAAPAGCDTS